MFAAHILVILLFRTKKPGLSARERAVEAEVRSSAEAGEGEATLQDRVRAAVAAVDEASLKGRTTSAAAAGGPQDSADCRRVGQARIGHRLRQDHSCARH